MTGERLLELLLLATSCCELQVLSCRVALRRIVIIYKLNPSPTGIRLDCPGPWFLVARGTATTPALGRHVLLFTKAMLVASLS